MPDRKHRIECECQDPTHFIQFHYAEWGGIHRQTPFGKTTAPQDADIYVYWVGNRQIGFWKRLWQGLRFAFSQQDMIVSDFVISTNSARETGQFLLEIADAGEKWESREP